MTIVACRNSLTSAGIADDELQVNVGVVSSAAAYLAEKQWNGWVYAGLNRTSASSGAERGSLRWSAGTALHHCQHKERCAKHSDYQRDRKPRALLNEQRGDQTEHDNDQRANNRAEGFTAAPAHALAFSAAASASASASASAAS